MQYRINCEEISETDEQEEDWLFATMVDGKQQIRIPEFSTRFEKNLDKFPQTVQAKALKMTGELCSGSALAFRNCKTLVQNNEYCRVRIGISYRLLIKINDNRILFEDILQRKG